MATSPIPPTPERLNVNRTALLSGFSEPVLRRHIQGDAAELQYLPLPLAVTIARALYTGHGPTKDVIRLIVDEQPTESMWLLTAAGQPPTLWTSISKAISHTEDHPAVFTWLFSRIGALDMANPL